MSLLNRLSGFYRPPFNRPATHYPVHPEELAAWLAAGKLGTALERGRFRDPDRAMSIGPSGTQWTQVPEYQMPRADFLEKEIAVDHCIELEHPVSHALVAYRVADFRHTAGGHTVLTLQEPSP